MTTDSGEVTFSPYGLMRFRPVSQKYLLACSILQARGIRDECDVENLADLGNAAYCPNDILI